MRKDWKKSVATLLAASMIFSVNTTAFAEEVSTDVVIDEAGAVTYDTDATYEGITDEVAVDSVAEVDVASETKTVSDPSTEPTSWTKDFDSAKYTYLMLLPELSGYKYYDTISGDAISNGKKLEYGNPALTVEAIEKINKEGGYIGISYNAIKLQEGYYYIYAYGIANEFDGNEVITDEANRYTPSVSNNFFGMSPADSKAAGVYDGMAFTWAEKSGDSKNNGKIMYEGAVIKWKSGTKAERDNYYKVGSLVCKNNKYATVSYNIGADGSWQGLTYNAYRTNLTSPNKMPYFYPKLQINDDSITYRNDKYKKKKEKVKEQKKLMKEWNKTLKLEANREYFEIRRRPIAGTSSANYIDPYSGRTGIPSRYMMVQDDGLTYNKNGGITKAALQFKTVTLVKDENKKAEDDDEEKNKDSNEASTSGKAAGYYVTYVPKAKELNKNTAANLDPIKIREYLKTGTKEQLKENKLNGKVDVFFRGRNRSNSNYPVYVGDSADPVLYVYGANNLEGIAVFREKTNSGLAITIGGGYYNGDKDCFITSIDED